jgi:hypothetical protein
MARPAARPEATTAKTVEVSEDMLDALCEIMDLAELLSVAAQGADTEHTSALNCGATLIWKRASRLYERLG